MYLLLWIFFLFPVLTGLDSNSYRVREKSKISLSKFPTSKLLIVQKYKLSAQQKDNIDRVIDQSKRKRDIAELETWAEGCYKIFTDNKDNPYLFNQDLYELYNGKPVDELAIIVLKLEELALRDKYILPGEVKFIDTDVRSFYINKLSYIDHSIRKH